MAENNNTFSISQINEINAKLRVQREILNNVLSKEVVDTRLSKFNLAKDEYSSSLRHKAMAYYKVMSNNKDVEEEILYDTLRIIDKTDELIADEIARRFAQRRIEEKVEKVLSEKQAKYIDEMRLSIIKKEKGPENSKTHKRYNDLVKLDKIHLNKNVLSKLRPESFEEIVGQERAVKALITKIASPYPQHILLYGPPGVGKTTAARIALEEAKKISTSSYTENSKFVEVDGTTLRWDPREIANPLLGSVHDPIYQGSKRDLAESGVPEPKPGLVTEAHGGILFIDEIGEMDSILQNKLLKVLEDKRVEFSSSYYDPDDENTPQYIKYLFEKGAPADFVLIGATTREPKDISPALRSRTTAVYFEPLGPKDIEKIVKQAVQKLDAKLEKGAEKIISQHTIEGRKAVNILSDAYSLAVYNAKNVENIKITKKDILEVIGTSRTSSYEVLEDLEGYEVGHIYGLAVGGFLGSTIEIEAVAYEAREKGKGGIRFNETAGSMAKDSVFNAASVIRKVTGKDIKDYDIHVNVIGGGNIDGPSAGCAITVAIISALENKEIRQDTAITGEISLRGQVKPVGGIFEKIYGARRKGIKQVILPEDNKKDIPNGLKDIKTITVKTIEEVLSKVFKQEN